MVKMVKGKPPVPPPNGMLFAVGGKSAMGVKAKTPAAAKKTFIAGAPPVEGYEPPQSMRTILGRDRIGLDIEGHDPHMDDLGPGAHRKEGKVVGVALAYGERDAVYYPTEHDTGANVPNPDQFYAQLRDEAKTFDGEMVGANLQYDLDWLRARHGIIFPQAKFRDVQIAEPLIDENRMTYKLDALAKDYLSSRKKTGTLEELYGKGYIKQMHNVHPSHAGPYAEADTMLPWSIFDKQTKKLNDEGLWELFEMESALTPLLLEMRHRGVRVDIGKADASYLELKSEQAKVEAEIDEMAQTHVDIWAADSIAIAFENLGLDYVKTKTGKASFVKAWLTACPHDIAQKIMLARQNDKIAGTFIDSYIRKGHIDGRLHCMFNQLKSDEGGTVSGRFSSSGPNLQNIPARHPVLGPLMRSMFIPEEGMLWGSLDWSQIEYRLLVHYASITKGIDANEAVRMYRNDAKTDFHAMASELTGVDRKAAKGVNFGVVYGMGVPTLARNLGISISEAQDIMAMFQEKAPFMRGMLDTASNAASRRGYIKTILGRRRRFDVWEVKERKPKGKPESHFIQDGKLADFVAELGSKQIGSPRRAFTHKALNALLQGSAADLMKKAMVEMWDAGLFNTLVPHLTVHDEFNSSVPDTKEGHEAFAEMRHIMETTLELEIPVLADGTMGKNWDEAK